MSKLLCKRGKYRYMEFDWERKRELITYMERVIRYR